MKELDRVWVVVLLSQGTKSKMYNMLEGWDHGDDYMYSTKCGGAICIICEDVETV